MAMSDTVAREKTGEELLQGGSLRSPVAALTEAQITRASGRFPQFDDRGLLKEHEQALTDIKNGQEKITKYALLGALAGMILVSVPAGLASGKLDLLLPFGFVGLIVGVLVGIFFSMGSPSYPHVADAKDEFKYLRFVREELCRRGLELPALTTEQQRYVTN